ncbi:MAG: DUF4258 domain-containing protein [Chloroflexi bacterium]|nr:DUF4258 domain-containing protein [Chloroflexota bacterium]
MAEALRQHVRAAILSGEYRLTAHAEQQREAEAVSMSDLEEALSSERLEILEDYPDDSRGHSTLLLGFTKDGAPLHAVVGLSNPAIVVIITLYRPDPKLWYDWRRRV